MLQCWNSVSPKGRRNQHPPQQSWIRSAQWQANQVWPPPPNCHRNKVFVPDNKVKEVLELCHSSQIFCHPGISKTLSVVRSHFWWKDLVRDVKHFVNSCQSCNQAKSFCHPLAGLHHPLPVPSHPWSHISMDFITGLPPSSGNTVILTVVMVHLITLPKLLSTKELSDVTVREIFRLYGLPSDSL